ncbi:MAG: prephenate dehydratase [Gammaproteobacteria bacterium]|nr:prephenate dehydratase [Gammaproteobacteria bacterium]|tara:strand:+ start:2458 stop:3336 length:879 start_codon:yes stop_codon:yes gene_type:complete
MRLTMSDAPERVAFLGPPGTFSHAAVDRFFGAGAAPERLSVSNIDDVFLAVEAGNARFGVVPVENSTEGAVNSTQDCLIDTSLTIVGEIYLPIEHNLLVRDPSRLADIRRIVSHKQSLGQCRIWLRAQYPDIELCDVSSNAEAARLAAEDPATAAIAGEVAAEYFGLQVVFARIQDRKNNTTRFLVLARDQAALKQRREPAGLATGHDKTSILVYTENKPGALFRVLEPFDTCQVSLTRIETRPARDDMWSYVFFIDFEGHIEDDAVKSVFRQLAGRAVKIKNLGSYPRARG